MHSIDKFITSTSPIECIITNFHFKPIRKSVDIAIYLHQNLMIFSLKLLENLKSVSFILNRH